ncbi:hypothetical protein SNEBB_000511 [Seison nebaliae]|nr:hypothetical protein SNEBB_000511 [Seison nebaliae]
MIDTPKRLTSRSNLKRNVCLSAFFIILTCSAVSTGISVGTSGNFNLLNVIETFLVKVIISVTSPTLDNCNISNGELLNEIGDLFSIILIDAFYGVVDLTCETRNLISSRALPVCSAQAVPVIEKNENHNLIYVQFQLNMQFYDNDQTSNSIPFLTPITRKSISSKNLVKFQQQLSVELIDRKDKDELPGNFSKNFNTNFVLVNEIFDLKNNEKESDDIDNLRLQQGDDREPKDYSVSVPLTLSLAECEIRKQELVLKIITNLISKYPKDMVHEKETATCVEGNPSCLFVTFEMTKNAIEEVQFIQYSSTIADEVTNNLPRKDKEIVNSTNNFQMEVPIILPNISTVSLKNTFSTANFFQSVNLSSRKSNSLDFNDTLVRESSDMIKSSNYSSTARTILTSNYSSTARRTLISNYSSISRTTLISDNTSATITVNEQTGNNISSTINITKSSLISNTSIDEKVTNISSVVINDYISDLIINNTSTNNNDSNSTLSLLTINNTTSSSLLNERNTSTTYFTTRLFNLSTATSKNTLTELLIIGTKTNNTTSNFSQPLTNLLTNQSSTSITSNFTTSNISIT